MTNPISKLSKWQPNSDYLKITSIDMHTEGEPLRIYLSAFPDSKNQSVLNYRKNMKLNYDHIRTSLMYEPRGHADMYGCIITEAENEDSDFAVIFLHNEGYSTMCGHAIIAITTAMYHCGVYEYPSKEFLKIDAPAGQITSFPRMKNNEIQSAYFTNVPSFVSLVDEIVYVDGIGDVQFDLAFGGAFYAYVNADEMNIKMDETNAKELIDIGMKIKNAVIQNVKIKHPFEDDLSFLYGTIFTGKAHQSNHSRNVCIFADGEVDRSPTGTGVSGRLAIHHYKNEIELDEEITIESILGTTFTCKAIEEVNFGKYSAIIPQVEGTAYITGKHEFLIHPNDPLKHGFLIR